MSSPATGRSLELYYIDGHPEGMLTAEMFNWTGHVLMTPRTRLAEALARPEAAFTGVYLLLGERDGESLAYVGEGEDISSRIRSHDAARDWWTNAILVTTAGNKLNKAHARYLESRLIEHARKVGRASLENGTTPARPGLSEADVSKMEAFLANLLVVLPAVRVDIFIERMRPKPTPATPPILEMVEVAASPRFSLHNRKHKITAHAVLEHGEFIVEEGSHARLNWEGKEIAVSGYAKLHAELRHSGILMPEGAHCVFTTACAFTSPSAAAAVINGRQSNGAIEWQTSEGLTYKAWEAVRLARSEVS